jgi:hypothetical protein
MSAARIIGPALLLACGFFFSACPRERTQGTGCLEDKDCTPEGKPVSAYRCEVETGACYCRTNEACQPREFCNALGFCQDKAGCEKNSDCIDPSLFCDTTTNTCLPVGRCTTDLHCELGKVCDTARSLCIDGCHTSGDCPGSSCRCGDQACTCTAETPSDLAKCQVGVCDPNFCADETFCQFGEQCGAIPDAGTALNQCYSDYDPQRRPYCDNCTFGGGVTICGTGKNYCLIDTAHPGNYFCGVDCSQGQTCPRGYDCSDVIVVYTKTQCTRSNPACAPNPATTCTVDADCKRGGTCVKQAGAATGECAGVCAVGEGEQVGYCTCLTDDDCAQETCSGGECTISRNKCVTDQDCKSIHCVDFAGVGGCWIGQNCAPADGLSCLEVR